MYHVFNKLKRSFAVISTLFITVLTTRVRSHENCRPEELMTCSKTLSFLDSGLTFASSKADLDKICPDLREAIKCIHGYARHCMSQEYGHHFKRLFKGTVKMAEDLCRNEEYQKEYLRHAPCMKRVESVNNVCFKRYAKAMQETQKKNPLHNTSQNDFIAYRKKKRDAAVEGMRDVCCAFREYGECSTHATRRECGEETAQFHKASLDRMSEVMIETHCLDFGATECGIITSSATSIFYKFNWLLLVLPFFLLR